MSSELAIVCLCRFDLIWLLLDKEDAEKDRLLARHILAVHQGKAGADQEEVPGEGAS
jgi:DNA replicative helicase MCM subunit Mcm2 (Cdc46/Mcm family)